MTDAARCGGCVLTITNRYRNGNPNPCYGHSTRIVGITPGSTDLQVMAFPTVDPTTNQPVLPAQNDTFVINGVPFSGTGFGFDSTNGTMNLGYDSTQTPPKPCRWRRIQTLGPSP